VAYLLPALLPGVYLLLALLLLALLALLLLALPGVYLLLEPPVLLRVHYSLP
jgi:hypothetical protein